jgi:hypothetical protein
MEDTVKRVDRIVQGLINVLLHCETEIFDASNQIEVRKEALIRSKTDKTSIKQQIKKYKTSIQALTTKNNTAKERLENARKEIERLEEVNKILDKAVNNTEVQFLYSSNENSILHYRDVEEVALKEVRQNENQIEELLEDIKKFESAHQKEGNDQINTESDYYLDEIKQLESALQTLRSAHAQIEGIVHKIDENKDQNGHSIKLVNTPMKGKKRKFSTVFSEVDDGEKKHKVFHTENKTSDQIFARPDVLIKKTENKESLFLPLLPNLAAKLLLVPDANRFDSCNWYQTAIMDDSDSWITVQKSNSENFSVQSKSSFLFNTEFRIVAHSPKQRHTVIPLAKSSENELKKLLMLLQKLERTQNFSYEEAWIFLQK